MKALLMTAMLFLIASGCSIFPETKPSAVHDFGYPNSKPSSETSPSTQQATVTVESPKWLTDTRIRYRMLYATPTQVRFYSLDRWIAPPSGLFEQLLNNSEKPWPTPISIQLQVFEQQFDSSNKAKVVMHFTAATIPDDNSHQSQKRDFNLQLPCPTPDAKGAVTGFNMLTKQAVDKVQAWVMESK